MWITAAVMSALFAGITAILSKCGIKNTNPNVATAIRTSVVLVMAWLIVFITGAYKTLSAITVRSWIFLILSGLATGASWISYFKALSVGEVSKVAAIDKASTVLSVLFAIILFADERELWWLKLIFLAVITVGTYLMTDIKRGEEKGKLTWLIFAVFVFNGKTFRIWNRIIFFVSDAATDTAGSPVHGGSFSFPPRAPDR